MLETLFAREAQVAAFLQMCACGAVAGAWMHASVGVYRKSRWLGAVWDALGAAALCAACLQVLLCSGDGVRLYGVLALGLGAGLYWLGVKPILHAGWKFCRSVGRRKAGNAGIVAEQKNVIQDELR